MTKQSKGSGAKLISRLKELMRQRGWSQKELAGRVGVCQSTIGRILTHDKVSGGGISEETRKKVDDFLRQQGKETRNVNAEAPLHEILQEQRRLDMSYETLEKKLQAETRLATVVFLDLVWSTGYRCKHGGVKALRKAHRHNLVVSEHIARHDGRVVKWLGDGVMGVFEGDKHAWRGFRAALDAIKALCDENRAKHADPRDEERIITRVGLCSGEVHFLTVPNSSTKTGKPGITQPVTLKDPIGTPADLSARLQSLAGDEVVLMDLPTFEQVFEGGLTDLPERLVELRTDHARETTYHPRTAACWAKDDCLEFAPVEVAAAPVSDVELCEIAKKQLSGDPHVFVYEPVECNVNGWKKEVKAMAVSHEPCLLPVKQVVYNPPGFALVENKLRAAKKHLRAGKEDEAIRIYEEVHEHDPRDFRANFRLAQYYRKEGSFDKARNHWTAAKKANPKLPRVWALTAVSHIENYLLMTGAPLPPDDPLRNKDPKRELERAIMDFSRAREFASENFDSQLEQYCTCFLATVRLMRGEPEDLTASQKLVEELDHWPSESDMNDILKTIARVLLCAATASPDEIEKAKASMDQASQRVQELQNFSGDVIQPADLDMLAGRVRDRLTAAFARKVRQARPQTMD